MLTLRRNFDTLFDELLAMEPHMPRQQTHLPTLALDLSEDESNFYVTVDLPGVPKESVSIDAVRGGLVIKAERKSSLEEKDEATHYHRVERSYGAAQRNVRLPETADLEEGVTAAMSDGVLNIKVTKREPPNAAKRIAIT